MRLRRRLFLAALILALLALAAVGVVFGVSRRLRLT
jgi:Tfp pilus assembly protein PilW